MNVKAIKLETANDFAMLVISILESMTERDKRITITILIQALKEYESQLMKNPDNFIN